MSSFGFGLENFHFHKISANSSLAWWLCQNIWKSKIVGHFIQVDTSLKYVFLDGFAEPSFPNQSRPSSKNPNNLSCEYVAYLPSEGLQLFPFGNVISYLFFAHPLLASSGVDFHGQRGSLSGFLYRAIASSVLSSRLILMSKSTPKGGGFRHED